MGRDNAPWNRQQRQLARRVNSRASYDRFLIVSEGSKTEPNYFAEIRAYYRLQSANLVVRPGAIGTEPLQVVEHAFALFQNGDPHKGLRAKAFEKVYAVFDRDDHKTFHQAIARARDLNGRLRNDLRRQVEFHAVASRPSFEYWLLLHFENVQSLIHRDEAIRRLRAYLPGYRKGYDRAFEETRKFLQQATNRARAINARAGVGDDKEPCTNVCELVDLLVRLKR